MGDRLRRAQPSRLTAEPGTVEFLRQLLEIAQESDHPMDKALARVLSKQIGEAEAVRPFDGALRQPFDYAQDRAQDGAPLDQARGKQGRQGSPQTVRLRDSGQKG